MYGMRLCACSLHTARPQKRQTPRASSSSKKHFTLGPLRGRAPRNAVPKMRSRDGRILVPRAGMKREVAFTFGAVQEAALDEMVQHFMRVRLVMAETCRRVLHRDMHVRNYPPHAA